MLRLKASRVKIESEWTARNANERPDWCATRRATAQKNFNGLQNETSVSNLFPALTSHYTVQTGIQFSFKFRDVLICDIRNFRTFCRADRIKRCSQPDTTPFRNPPAVVQWRISGRQTRNYNPSLWRLLLRGKTPMQAISIFPRGGNVLLIFPASNNANVESGIAA